MAKNYIHTKFSVKRSIELSVTNKNLLLLSISILFSLLVWSIFFLNNYSIFIGPDATTQSFVWWNFNLDALKNGVLPLWNPNASAGMSNIGEGQMGSLYPILLFSSIASHFITNEILLFLIVTILHFEIALIGSFLIARSFSLEIRYAILFAAIFVCSSSFLWRITGQPNIYWAECWFPFALFLFIRKKGNQVRNLGLSAICVALSLYSGHYILISYLMELFVFQILNITIFNRQKNWKTNALLFVQKSTLLGIFTLLVAFPQLVSTVLYISKSYRWVGGDNPIKGFAKVPFSYIQSNPTLQLEGLKDLLIGKNSVPDGAIYVGLAALFLTLYFIFQNKLRKLYKSWIIGLFVSFSFMFGTDNPIYSLFIQLPFASLLREPIRNNYLFLFCFSYISVIAFRTVFLNVSKWQKQIVILFITFDLLIIFHATSTALLRVILLILIPLLLIGFFGLKHLQGNFAALGLVCVLILNFWNIIPNLNNKPETLTPNSEFNLYSSALAKEVKNLQTTSAEPGRILIKNDQVSRNFGTYYNIRTLNSYSATLPSNYFDFLNSFGWNEVAYKLLNCNAILSTNLNGEIKIEKVKNNFGFAWFVERIKSGSDGTLESIKTDAATGLDIKKIGYVESLGNPVEFTGSNIIHSYKVSNNRIEISLESENNGFVVLSEIWDPNWSASIDGKSIELYRADGNLVGFFVNPSSKEVIIKYKPWPVFYGSLIPFLSIFLLLYKRPSEIVRKLYYRYKLKA